MGNERSNDLRFASVADRLEHQHLLDSAIANWTRSFEAGELESTLQSRGIPASKVATSEDMECDPQLAWRNHFIEVDHPTLGKVPVERFSYILSRTPGRITRSSPTLGGDTAYVLENMLGYSQARVEQLVALGVLQ
jgi:crotonobetainyl-CoA:carnitine CoA-transferase CaiB-like acyl-CoA transferase